MIWNLQQTKNIGWACAYRSQNSDQGFIVRVAYHSFTKKFAIFTLHSDVHVSATSTVFMIVVWNLHYRKGIGLHMHEGQRTLTKLLLQELHALDLFDEFAL